MSYSLIIGSPAIDAGYNEFANFPTDIFLQNRIQNNNNLGESYVNMGATESPVEQGEDEETEEPEEPLVTSTTDEIENSIGFFPNPFTQELNVKSKDGEDFDFEIVDFSGRTLLTKTNFSEYKISCDGIPIGIYFLIIKPKNRRGTQTVYKIIKSGN